MKLQNTFMSVGEWREDWNININERKTRFFSFSRRIGQVENHPALKRRNMSSVKSVKYLYAICNKTVLFRVFIQTM